ncbi:MAG: outer membrane lipoprotein-sorting protein [Rhodocyclaceae bacterium]|nr:outer membrane lipoprotein-sorting protein [Rhodocyclaceae bacterium]MBX3667661.1 outer membrane lipoprotein-sorting protein [Rhodocyclaceae bacterium]
MRTTFCLSRHCSQISHILSAMLLAAAASLCFAADDAQTILEKSDQIRFPKEGFQVDVKVTSTGSVDGSKKYRILSKGNDNTIVLITEPASERGQKLLMKGRDLWVFLPNVSQAVRLGLSQRLTGQVANGDLARANFTGDYTPAILRSEKIDGETYNVLELSAVDRGVTYAKVLYWVHQGKNWPHKAEFYSLSEKLIKTCYYEKYEMLGGKVRPTRLVMEDALKKGEKSVLDYEDMKLKELPDRIFTKQYLEKLD